MSRAEVVDAKADGSLVIKFTITQQYANENSTDYALRLSGRAS